MLVLLRLHQWGRRGPYIAGRDQGACLGWKRSLARPFLPKARHIDDPSTVLREK